MAVNLEEFLWLTFSELTPGVWSEFLLALNLQLAGDNVFVFVLLEAELSFEILTDKG